MLFIFVVVAVIGGFAVYVMTPAERGRLLQAAVKAIWRARDEIVRRRSEPDDFRDALRTRTRWAVVTPALIILNVAVFVGMVFGRGAISDPATLIAWGGNFAPRTTNGEWSRLLTAVFVHTGFFHLVFNMVGFAQIGFIVERFVGRLALVGVYLAAGSLASLQSLHAHPMDVSVGSSAAVFSIYGVFLTAAVWSWFQRSRGEPLESDESPKLLMVPLKTMGAVAPSAGLFLLYNAIGGSAGANLAGLAVGLVSGMVLSRNVNARKPVALHVAAVTLATIIVVGVTAGLTSLVTDVRPEIAQVVALETRTAGDYDKAVAQFRIGRISAEALAQRIDKKIMPELRAVHARLKALTGVPEEHQPLVASAEEYLRLRDESWRLRSEGLHKTSIPILKKAEMPEQAALAALQRIAPADGK